MANDVNDHQKVAASYLMEAIKSAAEMRVQYPPMGVDAEAARRLHDTYRSRFPPQQIVQQPHTAADCTTPDMIMELLKRGYAVIKMPEDGSLPEVLK